MSSNSSISTGEKEKLDGHGGTTMASVEVKAGSSLQTIVPVCSTVGCGKTATITKLMACSACKMVQYCSVDCQRSSWSVHKKDCQVIQKLRKHFEKEKARTEALDINMIFMNMMVDFSVPAIDADAVQIRENAGQPILGGAMIGFLGIDAPTRIYVYARIALAFAILWVARSSQSLKAYEEALEHFVELRKLTYRWKPYMCDKEILMILMKLHRDDDAASFFMDWCEKKKKKLRAALGPYDWKKVQWLSYDSRNDARLEDVYKVYAERTTSIEVSIDDPHYAVPSDLTLTMSGQDLDHWTTIQIMLLSMLMLKARVLTQLRLSGAKGCDTSKPVYQDQLRQFHKLLSFFDKPYDPDFLDNIVKLLQDEKLKDRSSRPETKTHFRVFASFFADEGPVVETMLDLIHAFKEQK